MSLLGCLPSLLGDGAKGIEIVYGDEKKIFCTGPARAAKTEQKSLVPAQEAQRTNHEEDSFHLYSVSPHSAGATLSSLSGYLYHLYTNLYVVKLIVCF